MEDLKDLKLNVKVGDMNSVNMVLNEKYNLAHHLLYRSLIGDISEYDASQNELIAKMHNYVKKCSALTVLNDPVIVACSDNKELESLKQLLTDESNSLRATISEQQQQQQGNRKSGNSDDKFEQFDQKMLMLQEVLSN